MATLAALIVAWAGFKMLTSGGNSGKVSEAKSMMTNVVIGLIILLAAWLMVDTVMKLFVNQAVLIGPWNQLQCVEQPRATGGGAVTPPAGATTTAPSTGACAPLTPLTDPLALQMEGGQTVIWANTAPQLQACVNKFIGKVGGSVTSAYRPAAYQTHLKEIHTKWCSQGLSSNTDPSCAAVKSAVQGELGKHGLSCSLLVGTTSNHSSGRAVDISGIAHGSPAVLAAASDSCLTWPLGASDRVHYELKSGCTCQ
jgi:hypothetical protein